MTVRLMGVGLLLAAVALSACGKKNDSNNNPETGAAVTPQTYPAPGLTFYSEDGYQNVQTEESYYFGNRKAYMYYLGVVPYQGRNASMECTQIMRAGTNAMPPVAYSSLGNGYRSRWKNTSRTRRYNQVTARRGDRFAQIQKWRTHDGGPELTHIQGGSYLVCLLDNNGTHDGMGFYFEAHAQMNSMVNVNMNFANYKVQFSNCYYGPQFQYQSRRGTR